MKPETLFYYETPSYSRDREWQPNVSTQEPRYSTEKDPVRIIRLGGEQGPRLRLLDGGYVRKVAPEHNGLDLFQLQAIYGGKA